MAIVLVGIQRKSARREQGAFSVYGELAKMHFRGQMVSCGMRSQTGCIISCSWRCKRLTKGPMAPYGDRQAVAGVGEHLVTQAAIFASV
jgi:hypothetical protein